MNSAKKIVFVIVEGPSDGMALESVFASYFENSSLYVKVVHGDITTQYGVNSSNIITKITDLIKEYSVNYHFPQRFFQEIIHIIDTDGAFIPKNNIVECSDLSETVYTLEEIKCLNKEKIIKRNEQKQSVINNLCTIKTVWGIPYKAFYMSCNLDHVLYDKMNSSDEEKENDSLCFAKKYKDDINGFIEYISDSDFSVTSNYKDSWKYIKIGLNSLNRHTNLGLLFKE